MARINESYAGGTPAEAYSKGITDLYVGPTQMADIRAFSYNAVGGSTAGNAATDLPDSVRSDIYRAAGAGSIFGVNLHQLLELGASEKVIKLFLIHSLVRLLIPTLTAVTLE